MVGKLLSRKLIRKIPARDSEGNEADILEYFDVHEDPTGTGTMERMKRPSTSFSFLEQAVVEVEGAYEIVHTQERLTLRT